MTAPYPTDIEFTISRTFDAPRDLVFKAWSEADRLAQWWGPKGMDIRVAKLSFTPGGVFHYAMQTPDGNEMWGIFHYRAIAAPETITFVNSFSDADGNVIRAPFSSSWPLEVLNTLTLTEQQDGKTLLTLRGGPINATSDEQQTFKMMHTSLQMGFGGTLDQLTAYLNTI